MSELFRKEIPLVAVSFGITMALLEYFLSNNITVGIMTLLKEWVLVIVTIASGVGLINVTARNIRKTQKREPYWYFDLWTIGLMIIVAIPGFFGALGTHSSFLWLNDTIARRVGNAFSSMVMFSIATAFYRTFRARTKETAVMLFAASLTMLRNAPIVGTVLPFIIPIGDWMNSVPVVAAGRAFVMTSAIGITAFTIRVLLWQEGTAVGVIEE